MHMELSEIQAVNLSYAYEFSSQCSNIHYCEQRKRIHTCLYDNFNLRESVIIIFCRACFSRWRGIFCQTVP